MPYVSSSTVKTFKVTQGSDGTRTTVTTTRDGNNHSSSTARIIHQPDPYSSGRQRSEKFSTPRRQAQPAPSSAGRAPSAAGAAIQGNSESIKKQLCGTGKLWEDPDFGACETSLYLHGRGRDNFTWKRPFEVVENPEFISEGASRFDVRQGALGDCWLLAAVASLSLHKELFNHVVPGDQMFSKDYCGMFRFRFWRFGKWIEVCVDDRLPTQHDQLVYMHSTEKNEFWSALLEKAYAKLFGSYEALKGGSSSEAMEDFTGGITEFFDMKQNVPNNLFDIMKKAMVRCSLMGCSIEADPGRLEARLANGLIMGHAYSITDVKVANLSGGSKTPLIRIRNPWGNEAEWKGAWGDSSREWQSISDAERKRLGLTFDDDGEFWMSFDDFVRNFEKMEVCHLGPDSLDANQLGGKPKRRWEVCQENGAWKRRLNAGGCRNFLNTFWTNPQFRVEVVDPDEDDDENLGTVIVGLMQKDMRKKRKEGLDMYTIGYAVYRLTDQSMIDATAPLEVKFFKFNASVAKAPSFINLREVCGRHKLQPGHYVIVPSTFEPDQEAEFLLRIFSERPNKSGELDEVTGMVDVANAEPPKELTSQDQQTEQMLQSSFAKIAGEDMEVDAYELRDILNAAFKKGSVKGASFNLGGADFNFEGFGIETCRSMVALMDCDQSGKLGFEEFQVLWNDLRLWKSVFKKYDEDKSGNFNSYELRLALSACGFRVSNKVFNSLVMRYSTKKGVVLFDDYILCCARLKTVFETFKAQDKDNRGNAIFNQDQFIQCIIYV